MDEAFARPVDNHVLNRNPFDFKRIPMLHQKRSETCFGGLEIERKLREHEQL